MPLRWNRGIRALTVAAAIALGVDRRWSADATGRSQGPVHPRACPRISGHPDFNGIWQAMNTAYWNFEGRQQRPWQLLAARRDRGDPGRAERGGGGTIPYSLRRLRSATRSREVAGDGSRSEVLHARRASRHVPQHAVPDLSERGRPADGLPVRCREPRYLPDRSPLPVDSWMGNRTGRGTATCWQSPRNGRTDSFGRSGRQLFEQEADGHRAFHAPEPEPPQYEATLDDPQTYTRPGRSRCRFRMIDQQAQLLAHECVTFADGLLYQDLIGEEGQRIMKNRDGGSCLYWRHWCCRLLRITPPPPNSTRRSRSHWRARSS